MRDWEVTQDRRDATMEFAKFMEANPETRQRCCDDPKEAKRQFAIIGQFYLQDEELPGQPPNDGSKKPIPKEVEFKVYDTEDQRRQNLVVLVLPSAKGTPTEEPTDIWMAAWQPWKT